jgi:hypothetical protein
LSRKKKQEWDPTPHPGIFYPSQKKNSVNRFGNV